MSARPRVLALALAAATAACGQGAGDAERLAETDRSIGAAAYRADAYLRLYDQRNQMLVLAETMEPDAARDALARAGADVYEGGVDAAKMDEVLALHRAAFQELMWRLDSAVAAGPGRARMARAHAL